MEFLLRFFFFCSALFLFFLFFFFPVGIIDFTSLGNLLEEKPFRYRQRALMRFHYSSAQKMRPNRTSGTVSGTPTASSKGFGELSHGSSRPPAREHPVLTPLLQNLLGGFAVNLTILYTLVRRISLYVCVHACCALSVRGTRFERPYEVSTLQEALCPETFLPEIECSALLRGPFFSRCLWNRWSGRVKALLAVPTSVTKQA